MGERMIIAERPRIGMDRVTFGMHFLSISNLPQCMPDQLQAFQRYLPPDAGLEPWGITATDLGYTKIPPGHPYPPFKHPESYTLNQDTGRVLDEYQVIYIAAGEGEFWSEPSGAQAIKRGSVFLLFPGVRHRYRPNPKTGWDEWWIGFSGLHARSIIHNRFSPRQPVHHIGLNPEMQYLFTDACDLARHESNGYGERIAAKIFEILVQSHLQTQQYDRETSRYQTRIRRACDQMRESLDQPFDSRAFAREQGISHTSFRRHFTAHVGMAPIAYLLELRLRKATRLLAQTTLPVQTIAAECGFDNPLYFSRFFKKRTGHPPSHARGQTL